MVEEESDLENKIGNISNKNRSKDIRQLEGIQNKLISIFITYSVFNIYYYRKCFSILMNHHQNK